MIGSGPRMDLGVDVYHLPFFIKVYSSSRRPCGYVEGDGEARMLSYLL
jgi:hypothetical protein